MAKQSLWYWEAKLQSGFPHSFQQWWDRILWETNLPDLMPRLHLGARWLVQNAVPSRQLRYKDVLVLLCSLGSVLDCTPLEGELFAANTVDPITPSLELLFQESTTFLKNRCFIRRRTWQFASFRYQYERMFHVPPVLVWRSIRRWPAWPQSTKS